MNRLIFVLWMTSLAVTAGATHWKTKTSNSDRVYKTLQPGDEVVCMINASEDAGPPHTFTVQGSSVPFAQFTATNLAEGYMRWSFKEN